MAGWLPRPPGAKDITIGLAHPPGHSFSRALQLFAQRFEERSERRLRVRVYPAAQLGGEREMQEMLALGSLDVSVTGLLNLYEPLFAVFELPYLYRDRAHVLNVMSNLPDSALAQSLPVHGVRMIGFLENGFRHVTNSRRPIHTPADLHGLIIRTPENPAQFETLKALGAAPTPMSFAELYTALAQGVVDGQENPLQNIWSARLAEVQEHIAMTRHIYNVAYVVMSDATWQRLEPADRALVRACMTDTTTWQVRLMAELDGELEEKLRKAGMRFTSPELKPFQEAVQPAYEAIFQQLGPRARELVREIQNTP
jgi:tripartite ATP-independent transporter DctP family solute receptor